MNKELVDSLYKQVKKIKDADIQKFTNLALDHAPPEFWIAPCSSSGHHHPPEDNGEGGVMRHLIKGIYMSLELARFFSISETNTDIVVSGYILHDIQKNGIPWGNKTDDTHGKIASLWLMQFPLKEPEKEAICNCVRYHMGQWVQPEEEVIRALHPTKNELIVQLTDYVCSREYASFLPGRSLSKRVIKNYKL